MAEGVTRKPPGHRAETLPDRPGDSPLSDIARAVSTIPPRSLAMVCTLLLFRKQAGQSATARLGNPTFRYQATYKPGRCDIKSLNLLPNVLAKQKAQEAKAFEAIFVKDGMVTEGATSNVFAV